MIACWTPPNTWENHGKSLDDVADLGGLWPLGLPRASEALLQHWLQSRRLPRGHQSTNVFLILQRKSAVDLKNKME